MFNPEDFRDCDEEYRIITSIEEATKTRKKAVAQGDWYVGRIWKAHPSHLRNCAPWAALELSSNPDSFEQKAFPDSLKWNDANPFNN